MRPLLIAVVVCLFAAIEFFGPEIQYIGTSRSKCNPFAFKSQYWAPKFYFIFGK